jgi:antitoxin VapB
VDPGRIYGYTLGKENMMPTAKVFQSGNSQAVRLPREFRFPAGVDEVTIRRQGDQIILEPPAREDWPEDFWKAFDGMSPDFERPRQVAQKRESLDS